MVAPAVYQRKHEKTEATIAARSVAVFEQHRSWRFAHRKADHHPFFMIDGSPVRGADGLESVPTYYVDLHECTCPSHRDGRMACKHMRAVRLWFNAVKRGEIVIPRRMTPGDQVVLEADAAVADELDVATSADALLDAYQAQQVQQREVRQREPEQDWWKTGDGGIVWLQDGDQIGPDDGELRTIGGTSAHAWASGTGVGTSSAVATRKAGLDALWPSCAAAGCSDEPEPRERYCHRHVLVDAF